MKKESFLVFVTLKYSVTSHAEWYESKVVEVSSWGNIGSSPFLYIRTVLNPNPAKCAGKWAGAAWKESNDSMNLAASIALAAKISGTTVRFSIRETTCSENGLPVMDWIQGR